MDEARVIVDPDVVDLEAWEWGLDDVADEHGAEALQQILKTLAVHVAKVIFDEITGKLGTGVEMMLRPDGDVECSMLEDGVMVRRGLLEMLDDFPTFYHEDEDYALLAKIRDRCTELIAARQP